MVTSQSVAETVTLSFFGPNKLEKNRFSNFHVPFSMRAFVYVPFVEKRIELFFEGISNTLAVVKAISC
jgi:hypothetical protein